MAEKKRSRKHNVNIVKKLKLEEREQEQEEREKKKNERRKRIREGLKGNVNSVNELREIVFDMAEDLGYEVGE